MWLTLLFQSVQTEARFSTQTDCLGLFTIGTRPNFWQISCLTFRFRGGRDALLLFHTSRKLAVGQLDGFLVCQKSWSAVLQVKEFITWSPEWLLSKDPLQSVILLQYHWSSFWHVVADCCLDWDFAVIKVNQTVDTLFCQYLWGRSHLVWINLNWNWHYTKPTEGSLFMIEVYRVKTEVVDWSHA